MQVQLINYQHHLLFGLHFKAWKTLPEAAQYFPRD